MSLYNPKESHDDLLRKLKAAEREGLGSKEIAAAEPSHAPISQRRAPESRQIGQKWLILTASAKNHPGQAIPEDAEHKPYPENGQ